MITEGNIVGLSFNQVFHPNFSGYIKYLSFRLPQRNYPLAIYQTNANMLAAEHSEKKRISGIKFTKTVYIFDVDVEVHEYNQEPVF